MSRSIKRKRSWKKRKFKGQTNSKVSECRVYNKEGELVRIKSRDQTVSSGERKMRALLNQIFPGTVPVDGSKPEWLESPETHSLMELDRYYPDMSLAFEYQGEQHDRYVKWCHGNRKGFKKQKKRDWHKARLCRKQGISLICVCKEDLSMTKMYALVGILPP